MPMYDNIIWGNEYILGLTFAFSSLPKSQKHIFDILKVGKNLFQEIKHISYERRTILIYMEMSIYFIVNR